MIYPETLKKIVPLLLKYKVPIKDIIDIDKLINRASLHFILTHRDILLQHGANIEIDDLVSKRMPSEVAKHLDILLQHGADANKIVSKLEPRWVAEYFDTLLKHGADVNKIALKFKESIDFSLRDIRYATIQILKQNV